MGRPLAMAGLLLLVVTGALAAHDLFLKPDNFFVAPGGTVTVRVLNGTFSKSENAVARDRLRDISLVTPDGVTHPDTSAWDDRSDTTTSVLHVRVGASGTYVIGASVRPRELKLEAKDFNAYLASDGVPDVLETRRRNDELGAPARERYSKHVKALVQIGDRRTEGYATALGYPAELIPLDNPYGLKSGGDTPCARARGGRAGSEPARDRRRPDALGWPYHAALGPHRQHGPGERARLVARGVVREVHPHGARERRHHHRLRVEVGDAHVWRAVGGAGGTFDGSGGYMLTAYRDPAVAAAGREMGAAARDDDYRV